MAKLYFEHGAMGAQKTANLLIAAYDYEKTGRIPLLTKPSADTKGDNRLVSRVGLEREVDFVTTPDLDVEKKVMVRREKARELNKDINVLLVDEAQFLQPEQVDQLFNLAVMRAIPVLAYGLRTDFQTHGFPGSRRLLEIAHVIRESITMCNDSDGCSRRGIFNARLQNEEFVSEGDQIAIDGEGDISYAALCGEHYIEHVGPIRAKQD
ncbi:MAG: thymidine kinase [Candidatus Saccharimonadales bacterium]